jgi:hypothetical protein
LGTESGIWSDGFFRGVPINNKFAGWEGRIIGQLSVAISPQKLLWKKANKE